MRTFEKLMTTALMQENENQTRSDAGSKGLHMKGKRVQKGAIDVCSKCGGTYRRGDYNNHRMTNAHLRHTAAYKNRKGPL